MKYALIETNEENGKKDFRVIKNNLSKKKSQKIADANEWSSGELVSESPVEIRTGCTRKGARHISHTHTIVPKHLLPNFGQ